MKARAIWCSSIMLVVISMLQVINPSVGSCYCIHRDTSGVEIPEGSDLWVEECCEGRPSHWPALSMPIPVYIYSATPSDLATDIETAIATWNGIESSYFRMQVMGSTGSKDSIPGAIVMGFDPDYCPDPNNPEQCPEPDNCTCSLAATGCKAVSVNPSWDGYQIQHCSIWADANDIDWNAPNEPNSVMVMTHELGHVLGIMHPGADPPRGAGGRGCGAEFLGATMTCCGGQLDAATLELDDIAAATSLYPKWEYTVEVVNGANSPIVGAAVRMDGTCFPHDGVDRYEGGVVLGDLEACLTGEMEPSATYVPDSTYVTGPDGRTGAFRVLNDEFCFNVNADGYQRSSGCQTLPAAGNYITTVSLNMLPVCDANGFYLTECQGAVTSLKLDGTGSSDPDSDDTLTYSWSTVCPGGSFGDSGEPSPTLQVDSSNPPVVCDVSLTVTDSLAASDNCSSSVRVVDTISPTIICPTDKIIECDASTSPSNTGMATVSDQCASNPAIEYVDNISPGSCANEFTISRTWTATDPSGNVARCNQIIYVQDTTPPQLNVSVDPNILWPPNHKMVSINPTINTNDNCDGNPVVELLSISVNESEETNTYDPNFDTTAGDGHTTDDIQVDGDIAISLRAERSGKGEGRNYTIIYGATDSCGNKTSASAIVTVPHSQ